MTINEIIEKRLPAENFSDQEIIEKSYGIEYFSSSAAGLGADDAHWWAEHRVEFVKRLDEIKKRENQTISASPPDYPEGRRLCCGHIVHYRSQVMTASLGSSCADCYDRMSG